MDSIIETLMAIDVIAVLPLRFALSGKTTGPPKLADYSIRLYGLFLVICTFIESENLGAVGAMTLFVGIINEPIPLGYCVILGFGLILLEGLM